MVKLRYLSCNEDLSRVTSSAGESEEKEAPGDSLGPSVLLHR